MRCMSPLCPGAGARGQLEQSGSKGAPRTGDNARDGKFGAGTTDEEPCSSRHRCCYSYPGRAKREDRVFVRGDHTFYRAVIPRLIFFFTHEMQVFHHYSRVNFHNIVSAKGEKK